MFLLAKTAVYAVIAVIIIIIIIIAAAIALGWVNLGTTNPSATPTATPTTGPTSTTSVASATNLTFTASVTSQGTTTMYNWTGQNIHSSGPIIRVDFANYAYIMDAGQQKSWDSTDSGSTWTTGNFTADWIAWSPQWTDYLNNLAHWTGSGTYSYTNQVGEAIVLSNIVVNPTIPASAFAHT